MSHRQPKIQYDTKKLFYYVEELGIRMEFNMTMAKSLKKFYNNRPMTAPDESSYILTWYRQLKADEKKEVTVLGLPPESDGIYADKHWDD